MQWGVLANIARSRVFLLCVILILTGFLAIHYLPPGTHLNIVVHELPVKRIPPVLNHSRNVILYRDELELDKSENVPINVELQDHQTVFETPESNSDHNMKCKKKVDVSFLKVHKAGSTTVMNIFIRFVISNHLNMVLPPKSSGFGFNYLGYGKTVSKDGIVPLPKNASHYNILCNHVVYNKNAFRSILPNDTVYVGILREPVSHFTSAASYYGFYKALQDQPGGVTMSQFLSNPKGFRLSTYFVNNRMSFDLGIPKLEFNNDAFVESYIQELDADYELMMIMEYFHESLVLLKRTLCWDTKDILYVPLNGRANKANFNLNENDLENLMKWNSADFKLYNHFYTVFKRKMESHGQDFKDEVESFRAIQNQVKSYCLWSKQAPLTVNATKWSDSFIVTDLDCHLMTEPELATIKRLIDQAWVKYRNSVV